MYEGVKGRKSEMVGVVAALGAAIGRLSGGLDLLEEFQDKQGVERRRDEGKS